MKTKTKEAPPVCEWCGEGTPATARVSITDIEGVVMDIAALCLECCKRGVTWNGHALDAYD